MLVGYGIWAFYLVVPNYQRRAQVLDIVVALGSSHLLKLSIVVSNLSSEGIVHTVLFLAYALEPRLVSALSSATGSRSMVGAHLVVVAVRRYHWVIISEFR